MEENVHINAQWKLQKMCESQFYLGLKNDLVLFTIVNVFIIKTTPVYYREYNPAHIGYLNLTYKQDLVAEWKNLPSSIRV